MKYLITITTMMGILFMASCTADSGSTISVEDAWVRAASMQKMDEGQDAGQSDMSGGGEMGQMSGTNSAAYMVIQNKSSTPDQLISANSDAAQSTEIHLSEMKDGVMSMRPVDGVDVPARGTAELKPGSYHIMLVGLKRDLLPGEKLRLILEFENAGEVEVEAEVRAP